ncbi:hypothetical protein Mgra_00007325, partial [Meloidogyne graminicola]
FYINIYIIKFYLKNYNIPKCFPPSSEDLTNINSSSSINIEKKNKNIQAAHVSILFNKNFNSSNDYPE